MFVSNSSTVILLAKVSLLEIFLKNFGSVVVPNIVFDEFIEKENSFDCLVIKKQIEINKIKVQKIKESELKEILVQFRLHAGEAAAYKLFDKEKHEAILTDDKELIKLCRLNGVPFVCAMAIVVRMFEKKLLSKEIALNKLNKLFDAGRYSGELFEFFKHEVI